MVRAGTPVRRARRVYEMTDAGRLRFSELVADTGPHNYTDDGFGVHFAFFGQTQADIRLRILEGRRTRLEERLDGVRAAMARTRERMDSYTLELQRHGLEAVERDVRWLNELIAEERRSEASGAAGGPYPPTGPTETNPGTDRGSEKESS